ncbi:MAG: CD225/dispanin family protein [Kribbellaceae bacterium]
MSYIVEPHTAATSLSPTRAPDLYRVRSHLAAAVVCALVCFAPLGIAAVVYAGNVRTRLALGDVEGARHASRMAKRLCWASATVTMGFLLVIVVGAGGYSDIH